MASKQDASEFKMKVTKSQLKALIREQVAAVIGETDWRPTNASDYHRPQSKTGPYASDDDAMVPWDSEADEWYEDRFIADQDPRPDLEDDDDDGWHDLPELSPAIPDDDPSLASGPPEQSALGKYRKGKTTDFKEDMKDVAGLMSQAGAYEMPPNAMQRLMRVIKEYSPALSDEELHDFAQQLIKSGSLDTALGAPEEVGLQEEENNPWAICTSSVGREDKEKYEKCVKSIKKTHGTEKDEKKK